MAFIGLDNHGRVCDIHALYADNRGVCGMSRYCDDCTWDAWSGIILCPKHAAVDKLLAALKQVEWIFSFGNKKMICPECREYQSDGHADVCKLRNAIADAEKP
jgi:hypothetical protein